MVNKNPTRIKKVLGPALIRVGSFSKGSEVASKGVTAESGDLFCSWLIKTYAKNMKIKNLFSGRIGRKNYFLVNLILFGISVLVATVVVTYQQIAYNASTDTIVSTISTIQFIATLISLPWVIRRLHDLGITGWMSLFVFISYLGSMSAVFGFIFNLILFFKKGNEVSNNYGSPSSPDRGFWSDIFNINEKVENNTRDH